MDLTIIDECIIAHVAPCNKYKHSELAQLDGKMTKVIEINRFQASNTSAPFGRVKEKVIS